MNRLMVIACIDRVRFVLQVPERESVWIKLGTPAEIDMDADDPWRVRGQVSRLSHALDPQTRTMQVEIDFDNRERKLLPGMYGNARLVLQEMLEAYAIPVGALYSRKGENYIMLVVDGVARRQPVRITYDDGREVAVVKLVKGKSVLLAGTDEVIISNKGELRDGQRVKTNRPNPKTSSLKPISQPGDIAPSRGCPSLCRAADAQTVGLDLCAFPLPRAGVGAGGVVSARRLASQPG
jgi:RND family efflux transporter MFP subunit